jgi:hypothetical protein
MHYRYYQQNIQDFLRIFTVSRYSCEKPINQVNPVNPVKHI